MYDKNVFINCPFDEDYIDILQAITFAIVYAKFIPRSALETINSGQERLAKICQIIKECQFSIHDISRVETGPSSSNNLPRFNMPFEFGIFYGAEHFGRGQQKNKKSLVLDSEKYRFQKTLSDIAGKDPGCHDNNPEKAIACIRRFLCDKAGISNHIPGEEFFQRKYKEFKAALPGMLVTLQITPAEIREGSYWNEFVQTIKVWNEENPNGV